MGKTLQRGLAWGVLFLLQFYPQIGRGDFEFRTGEYDAIRDTALSILQKYPPDQYYYVGLGKSPTPLITFMNLIGIPSAALAAHTRRDRNWAEPIVPFMESYIRTSMPGFDPASGKKILLIDLCVRAKTLTVDTQAFREYFQAAGLPTDVRALGIAGSGRGDIQAEFDGDVMDIANPMTQRAHDHGYDLHSPLFALDPENQGDPDLLAAASGLHQSLVTAIQRRIEEDHSLTHIPCFAALKRSGKTRNAS